MWQYAHSCLATKYAQPTARRCVTPQYMGADHAGVGKHGDKGQKGQDKADIEMGTTKTGTSVPASLLKAPRLGTMASCPRAAISVPSDIDGTPAYER